VTPLRACNACGRITDAGRYCAEHQPPARRSPSSRNPIPRALRARVLRRDTFRCQIQLPGCLGAASEVDHVIPVSKGGTHAPGNLRAACPACNQARNRAHNRNP
jgi:5-methylcytosine-specific restriction endonuclease McrA